MASTLPFAAHGDTLPVVKIVPKYEGEGNNRRVIGIQCDALLLFDHCTRVPITVIGAEASTLPSNEILTERNMKLQLVLARFQNLVVSFSGGDYGSIRYKGTATGIEVLNPTLPPVQSNSAVAK